jgi:hypothetical protein
MIAFLILFIHVVISPLKTKARLEAEIIVLRHQLNVLHRRVRPKPKCAAADRLLFIWPSFGGIGRGSDCIGPGSRALRAGGRGYPGRSAA